MWRVVQYYSQFEGFRGNVGRLPGWARFILAIVALPGLLLIGLSILAFVVSLLALLVLTLPAYRLLKWLTTSERRQSYDEAPVVHPSPGRRNIEVKIVE